jgi:hypothetical protein
MEFNKKFKRSPDGSLLITDEYEKYILEFMNSLKPRELLKMYADFAELLQHDSKFARSLCKDDWQMIVVCFITIVNSAFPPLGDSSISDEKRFADTITGICTLVFMLKAIQSSE